MKLRIGWLVVLSLVAACTGPVEKGEGDGNNGVVIITNNETTGATNNDPDPVITECGPGRTLCGEACADTEIDGAHCGNCDRECSDGTVCSEGNCVAIPSDCRNQGECPARYFCDDNTGLCEVGCSTNDECPAGAYCELESHSCLCSEAGNVVCGSECVPESPTSCGTTCETCPPIANGSAVCTEGQCEQECDDGHMMCDGTCAACPTGDGVVGVSCLGDRCVANECEAGYEICDGTCADCPATTGDESLGCDGAQCVITDCPAGTKLCGGECADCPEDPNGTTTCDGNSCVLVCGNDYHSCGGFCAPDTDPDNCGPSCSFCDDDPNGNAVCDGGSCGLECFGDYRACGGACAECPAGPGVMSTMCAGSSCVVQTCDTGFEPCTGGCCKDAPDGIAFDYDTPMSDMSIAVDSRGYPHIAMASASANAVYYIWWDGSAWHNEYVTSGWDADIELDATDRPHLGIWKRNPDEAHYAVRDGAGNWTVEEVDSSFSDVGMTPDLELVAGTPHLAYFDLEYKNLEYAVKSGGSWNDETVVSNGEVGFSPSLVMVGGAPHIVYRDETDDRTMYSYKSGGSWSTQVVEGTLDSGNYSSLAADSLGDLHLVFEEENTLSTPSKLHYVDAIAGVWGASTPIAVNASRPSLVLDGSDSPVVVYSDTSNSGLSMTSAANGWTRTVLDASSSMGEQNHAAYSPITGKIHVAYQDYTNRDVKYLTFDP